MLRRFKLVSRNFCQKNKFLEKLAENGDPKEQYHLGMLYLNGSNGYPADPTAARRWLAASASQGFPEAESQMGKLLLSGKCVRKSLPDAFRHFVRSASKGHSDSMATAGHMLLNSIGVKEDFSAAFDWLMKAAKKSNFRAMCDLGFMYAEGKVPPDKSSARKDYHIAMRLAEKSGEQDGGNLPKSQRLAGYLSAGQKNLPAAKLWFEKAAKGDDLEAMASLGRLCWTEELQMHFDTKNGHKQKDAKEGIEKAFYWLKKAANLSSKKAQRDLGFMLVDGYVLGIERDMDNAIFYLATAGLFGMPDAFLRLAEIYALGEMRYKGMKISVSKAKEYIKSARKTARENNLETLPLETWHAIRDDPRKIRNLIDTYETDGIVGKRVRVWSGELSKLKGVNIN